MRRFMIAALLVALATVAPVTAQTKTDIDTKVEDAVRQAVATYATAWNAADAHALAELYTVYGDYTGFGSVMTRGRQDIEARYTSLFSGSFAQTSAALDVSSIRMISSDVVLVDGRIEIIGARGANGKGPLKGMYHGIMTHDEGRWLFTSFWSKVVDPMTEATE